MANVLVAEHETGELRELDTATGRLLVPDTVPARPSDRLERLWPKDARGRWQVLGETTFVLHRVGTRLHLRAGAVDLELEPSLQLSIEEGTPDNTLVAIRKGETVFRLRYPSQQYRMTNDSFIDPYEEEDDFDLVCFALNVASDEGRRKRMFATDDEIRLGDLTLQDELRAAWHASAAVFPRRRVLDLVREVKRWTWRWSPSFLDGWGPCCALCGKNPISRSMVGVDTRSGTAPSFTAQHSVRIDTSDLGLCEDCLALARGLFADVSPPRAEAVLADVVRALRARGALKDDEIADRLTERSVRTPPEPVAAPGVSCTVCRRTGSRCVRGPDASVCESCVDAACSVWRDQMDVAVAAATVVSCRWEDAGYVFCFQGPRRLYVWLVLFPDQPVHVLESELNRWAAPFEDVAVDDDSRQRLRNGISDVVRKKHGRDVIFLDA